ncbi:hypothetical protein GCM10009037_03890 [Halarchaeum grantii]|uniref:Uncharacterized protein n=1 Tax=Halarchaeum grantii TaxID=1193105 RepID=A0A830F9A1_9EURY|nr:DUF5784 family protein [Halarchaeum grantii]GGL23545.1 hypothetical protein GCM10009037_03890 [Halarchaeum grantii]
MAHPLRFRHSEETWSAERVRSQLLADLDDNIGATATSPWFKAPPGYAAQRFEMDNGDLALFAYDETGAGAYWLGNTETPSALWRTDKCTFAEAPFEVSRWAQRELLAGLHEEAPWLGEYRYLSWFFLPVFYSKDGRETTREFFREHAAGFPDADREDALAFYDDFLKTGVFEEHRHVMAGKLGTSEYLDLTRTAAAMGEFDAAWLLHEAGYEITPEIEVATGHSLDFRAERPGEDGAYLVEVTRPLPPSRRSAGTPAAAIRDTVDTKANGDGQLAAHGGGATLFVDCSSFPDDDWAALLAEEPEVQHRPAVVFRVRPTGVVEGYTKGAVPLELEF